ncbi:hypothetical protein BDV35DRAFT_395241 [Aspergillus flavus]|uniref:C6 finger domain protein n=1 Tax=Aspergillus flavus TaxID=5059 RepID=A0A364LPC7_ASPFL|nr:hypothetical protein BDV35DRAFT_395241 [Aspergillus flavus]KAJ1712623.1 C6 finger domain protein [Aspergillus flavus]RAQ56029.1 C6 finger domain protein [Aspergillus flavus]RAQ64985.1 C6 finger domain protein [Aspergillus flavus]RMZ44557.1 C6 finger domain protein [Aspergillus flavus]
MENANSIKPLKQEAFTSTTPTEPGRDCSGVKQQDVEQTALDDVPAQKVPKRRTKTGCLTCRQRRIKCGEEKPVCKNCVKSKRECKGYAQRLVFKNPLGIPGFSNLQQTFTAATVPLSSGYNAAVSLQEKPGSSRQPALAPKPVSLPTTGHDPMPTTVVSQPQGSQQTNAMPTPYGPGEGQTLAHPASKHYMASESPSWIPSHSWKTESEIRENYIHHGARDLSIQGYYPDIQGSNRPSHSSAAPQTLSNNTMHSQVSSGILQLPKSPQASYSAAPHQEQQTHQFTPAHPSISPSQVTYMDEDDDYYDVETDEEPEEQASTQNFNQLSLIMTSANRDERQLRSFTTYLNEPNILASYHPTLGSSPLNNPKTARVFLHFIHSTGPSLSIFERHPIDPSTMFGAPVPAAQQGLWTYTLPFKALEHPALLQAILALSSLHISFLQEAPATVSMKHYHYALKRIGAAVGLPTRRKQVGTLAAAQLLGYYEVMAADPSKWNNHIAGAAQLVREIDYAGITRDLRAHRRRICAQRYEVGGFGFPLVGSHSFNNTFSEDDPFAEKENSIDENIIGTIVGRAVNYDDFGEVDDGYDVRRSRRYFTRKDIENFRVQCDLYWWYFKQDIFQSMLTGNGTFMPSSQWGQCPPRAGLGRLDAIYGSADHLWLLLARVTTFGIRDRKRKLAAMAATGGNWKPGPELSKFMARFVKGPPDARARPASNSSSSTSPAFSGVPVGAQAHGANSAGSSPWSGGGSEKSVSGKSPEPRQSHNSSHGSQPGAPPMYGMVPVSGPKRLPLAFVEATTHAGSVGQDDDDSESLSYSEAEHEWESILAAFETFAHALGPYFRPLPSDSAPPISTVFGPALQYRTHTIAVIWGYYYIGRILLHRMHPCMPPAMMVAAGVAAPTTAEFSQIIGKIAAGIYYPQLFNLEAGSLSPTLGSCLIEITVPIFFAAVQFTDPPQREWTVAKLRTVSRLTGWKASDAILHGCESAWRAAAKQGRGPPYYPQDEAVAHQPPAWMSATESQTNENSERRFVKVKPPYVHYAMGVLSLEDDMENLGINERV